MAQGKAAAAKLDPTLQMVNTCGYLSGIPVDVYLKVCKSEDFAKELCHRSHEEDCDMVLMLCRKQVCKYVLFSLVLQHVCIHDHALLLLAFHLYTYTGIKDGVHS